MIFVSFSCFVTFKRLLACSMILGLLTSMSHGQQKHQLRGVILSVLKISYNEVSFHQIQSLSSI